jgi:hypothetical protein
MFNIYFFALMISFSLLLSLFLITLSLLRIKISMTDLGLLHSFLGIAVTHDVCDPFLSQRQYILDLLSMAGMNDFHPYHTSTDTSSKLSSSGKPFSDATLYYCLAGSLKISQSPAMNSPDV